ncbi:class I SAM-dependent methyltransferase [Microbacteriaceae bacterium VKM Ac-2854]|nr:class I SAM-dependent methyltransferase [Microbacteriaceae bacterium VKM Ac-2854]
MHPRLETAGLTAASAALVGALDPAAPPPSDLYSPEGAAVYEHFTSVDHSEIAPLTAAARQTTGTILELASGGGRVTVPLLSLGRPVVALDLSPTMVETLRARIRSLPAARIASGTRAVEGDMTAFRLPERFGVVVLAATSVALLDAPGRRALFDSVRGHLVPDGTFLISASSPGHHYRPGWQDSRMRAVPGPAGGSGAAVVTTAVDADGRRRSVEVVHVGLDPAGRPVVRTYRSRVNVIDADALAAEAERAGFRVAGRSVLPEAEETTLLELAIR